MINCVCTHRRNDLAQQSLCKPTSKASKFSSCSKACTDLTLYWSDMRESQGNMSERRLSHQFPFPKIIVHLLNKQKKQQIQQTGEDHKQTTAPPPDLGWICMVRTDWVSPTCSEILCNSYLFIYLFKCRVNYLLAESLSLMRIFKMHRKGRWVLLFSDTLLYKEGGWISEHVLDKN